MGFSDNPKCLWKPNSNVKLNIDNFTEYINKNYNQTIDNYDDLYNWSVVHYRSFWEAWWEYGGFVCSSPPQQTVDTSLTISDIPKWFTGTRLNFAENLLRFNDDRIAVYAAGEGMKNIKSITYAQLNDITKTYAQSFDALGIREGDRIAAYVPNGVVALEAMLGTAAIGAIWSSASPDFGISGVSERFSQIDPSILISVEAVVYNGKVHDHLGKVKQLVKHLPTLKKVIIAPFVHKKEDIDISDIPKSIFLDEFLNLSEKRSEPFEFKQLPFDHPQFIMFSSGTTGVPKCIVHSIGGTLIQIAKEHVLHCNVTRDDVMMYYTTTGWMMWNWLVAGLFTGCSLVLYDGSPLIPTPNILWDLVDKLGITILGTGAKWLSVLESKGVCPRESNDLSSLRSILSTGSPLSPSSFEYVYRDIKKDLVLGSISGGTDIISCFIGSHPGLPVYSGEIQCRLLGMAIEARDMEGNIVYNESGELVCTTPFPSMPIYFWNDEGNIKYLKAYFSKYPNIWTHGDYCQISSATGGIVMLGRSDGTLNPNGVRFGSSEIYNLVEQFVEIIDSLCVAQRNKLGEERVILFIRLDANYEFTPELCKKINTTIRNHLSARHVPAKIIQTYDIPYTVSGKKVEVAVRQIISGEEVKNKGALINPESLDFYDNLEDLTDW